MKRISRPSTAPLDPADACQPSSSIRSSRTRRSFPNAAPKYIPPTTSVLPTPGPCGTGDVVGINCYQKSTVPWETIKYILDNVMAEGTLVRKYSERQALEGEAMYDLQCNIKRGSSSPEALEAEIETVDVFLRTCFGCNEVVPLTDCSSADLFQALETVMLKSPSHVVIYMNPILALGFDVVLQLSEKQKTAFEKRKTMKKHLKKHQKEKIIDVFNSSYLFPNLFTDIVYPACGISGTRSRSPMVTVVLDSSLGISVPVRTLECAQFLPVELGTKTELRPVIYMWTELNEILDEIEAESPHIKDAVIDLDDLYTAVAGRCDILRPLSLCNHAESPKPSYHANLSEMFAVPFNIPGGLERTVGISVYVEIRNWENNRDDAQNDWVAIRAAAKRFLTRIGFEWTDPISINSDNLTDPSNLINKLGDAVETACETATYQKLDMLAITIASKFGTSLSVKTADLGEGQTVLYTELIRMVEKHSQVRKVLLFSSHSNGDFVVHSTIPLSPGSHTLSNRLKPHIEKQSAECVLLSFCRAGGQLPVFKYSTADGSVHNYTASVPLLNHLRESCYVRPDNALRELAFQSEKINNAQWPQATYYDYSGWMDNCQGLEEGKQELAMKPYSSIFTSINGL